MAALGLASCGRDTSDVPPLPAQPSSKIDISGTIVAKGNDPAWSLTIAGKSLTLRRAGQPDMDATAPGAVIEPGKARWTATSGENHAFTATLYASDCTDGTGGKQLPFVAEVDVVTDVLHGCASKAAAPAAKTG